MSYCIHGHGNPSQCLTCVSTRQTERLEAVIRETAELYRAAARPAAPSAALAVPPSGKPLTKAEILFLSGNDAIFGVNGELFTASCGRWIRTQ